MNFLILRKADHYEAHLNEPEAKQQHRAAFDEAFAMLPLESK
jgi:hypothetical protein